MNKQAQLEQIKQAAFQGELEKVARTLTEPETKRLAAGSLAAAALSGLGSAMNWKSGGNLQRVARYGLAPLAAINLALGVGGLTNPKFVGKLFKRTDDPGQELKDQRFAEKMRNAARNLQEAGDILGEEYDPDVYGVDRETFEADRASRAFDVQMRGHRKK